MAQAVGQRTREQELKAAFRKARLPEGAHRIYYHLLYNRASFGSGEIQDGRQPKSIAAFARSVDMTEPSLKRGLKILADLGWVKRTLHPGRANTTTYQLDIGTDMPPRPQPVTDAERMRRYRERKKLDRLSVTESGSDQRNESGSDQRNGVTQNRVTRYATERNESAGQSAAMLKDITEGGKGVGGADCENAGDPAARAGTESPPGTPVPVAADLTLTIGDRTLPAIVCLGCGELCWVHISFDGCHASCTPLGTPVPTPLPTPLPTPPPSPKENDHVPDPDGRQRHPSEDHQPDDRPDARRGLHRRPVRVAAEPGGPVPAGDPDQRHR